ncbi:MAG: hypothetical protein ACOC0W_07970 [Desulfosalsimonas sp.]
MTEKTDKKNDGEVIELSEIAVGTSREDEKVIELTEDLVDEARNAISGATLETGDDDRQLELEKQQKTFRKSGDENSEQEIARELETYFPMEEEPVDLIELDQPVAEPVEPGEVSVEDSRIESALERVIERKYRQRIETLIDEIIRRKVTEDIESIKELILNRGSEK